MNITDKFLHFIFSHQLVLIEVLFALILGLCVIWLFAHLQKEVEPAADDKKFKDLEKTLERVLEKAQATALQQSPQASPAAGAPATAAKPGAAVAPTSTTAASLNGILATQTPAGATATATAPAAAVSAEQLAELSKLKSENEAKALKLAELEKALTQAKEGLAKAQSAPAGVPATDVVEFQKRIKELESRLGEYEIIEDDIANLSLYKEENTRLKNELQKIKGSATLANAPAAAPVVGNVAATVATPKTENPVVQIDLQEKMAEEKAPEEKAIDPDKLVQEAAEMATKPVEETAKQDDGKDQGQKLIEEFESFMKGAGR